MIVPEFITTGALAVARSRYADFCRADSWVDLQLMVVPLINIATKLQEKQSVRMTSAIDQRFPGNLHTE